MNMYDDYNKYIIENEELLNYLKDSESSVMYCLSDVLEVLDYIYKKYFANIVCWQGDNFKRISVFY